MLGGEDQRVPKLRGLGAGAQAERGGACRWPEDAGASTGQGRGGKPPAHHPSPPQARSWTAC